MVSRDDRRWAPESEVADLLRETEARACRRADRQLSVLQGRPGRRQFRDPQHRRGRARGLRVRSRARGCESGRARGRRPRSRIEASLVAKRARRRAKTMDRFFTWFAGRISFVAGQPVAFVLAFGMIVVWGVTGPVFHYLRHLAARHQHRHDDRHLPDGVPDPEQQNRDAAAMQAKLDELLRAVAKARAIPSSASSISRSTSSRISAPRWSANRAATATRAAAIRARRSSSCCGGAEAFSTASCRTRFSIHEPKSRRINRQCRVFGPRLSSG